MEECSGGQGDEEKDGQASTTRKKCFKSHQDIKYCVCWIKNAKTKQPLKTNKQTKQKNQPKNHTSHPRKKKKKAIKSKP